MADSANDKNRIIAEKLRKLTEERGPVAKELMNYYKRINENNKKILDCIKNEAKEIPQIAKETGLDTKTVLWHLTGLVKYGKAQHFSAKSGYMKYKAT